MEVITKNKKALFNFTVLEKILCGIKLVGSEVKSIKRHDVSIAEAYCFINDNEVFVKGMHVTEFKEAGTHNNHNPIRDRKLLLKKKEIKALEEHLSQKGLTLIPLCILLTPTGFLKMEIGLCKGKKVYDKREDLKKNDAKKEIAKALKV